MINPLFCFYANGLAEESTQTQGKAGNISLWSSQGAPRQWWPTQPNMAKQGWVQNRELHCCGMGRRPEWDSELSCYVGKGKDMSMKQKCIENLLVLWEDKELMQKHILQQQPHSSVWTHIGEMSDTNTLLPAQGLCHPRTCVMAVLARISW